MAPTQRSCEFIYGTGTTEQFDSPALRAYVFGCLLLLFGMSVCPDQLSFKNRLQSFVGLLDDKAAERLAQDGFYSDRCGDASCCHCGASADKLKASGQHEQRHSNHAPDCAFLRLQKILERSASAADIVADAANFEKMMRKLLLFLSDSKIGLVESFGFGKAATTLAALRLFFKKNSGDRAWKPGELVETLHSFSEFKELASLLMRLIESLNQRDSADPRDSITSQQRPIHNELISAVDPVYRSPTPSMGASTSQKALEDSPLCHLCGTRAREVVLLPCAHLLYCRQCIFGVRKCPACGKDVVADKVVFLT